MCGIEFEANIQLDIHVQTKHGSGHQFVVVRVVQNLQTRTIHVQTKHGSRQPFRWGMCGIKFTDKNQLEIHLQTHGSRHQCCCGLCGKIFTNENQSNIHDQSDTRFTAIRNNQTADKTTHDAAAAIY